MALWRWTGAAITSLAVHAGLLGGLGLMLTPEPLPPQKPPRAQLTVTSYQVEQSDAPAKTPEGIAATENEPKSPQMAAGAIPRVAATALTPAMDAAGAEPLEAQKATLVSGVPLAETVPQGVVSAEAATGAPPEMPRAKNLDIDAPALPVAAPRSAPVQAADIPVVAVLPASAAPSAVALGAAEIASAAVRSKPAAAEVLVASLAPSTSLATASPQELAVATIAPSSASVAPAQAAPMRVSSLAPTRETARLAAPPSRPATRVEGAAQRPEPVSTSGAQLSPAPSNAAPASEKTLPSEFATASLAWSGAQDRPMDPLSLSAIQAFMQPSDIAQIGAQNAVRDGIEALLAAVPCARLQTVFDPASGALQLRGHIPQDGLRGPVLTALRAQIGDAIAIEDTLLILPRPQCQALSGIADAGLPQSTDQITNPRVVGPQGFARNLSYTEGARLEFELTAPDYPSVVYVDYFTADGTVLHLQPNEVVPLEAYAAEAEFTVGNTDTGKPALELTIAPPFGQEIAVAFAATRPVFEGLRPISEPAEPYLRALRARIAELRSSDPDFKGEWVYFFISTHAK